MAEGYYKFAKVVGGGSDTIIYAGRALWVGGAGNVTLEMNDGAIVLISGVPEGTFLPIAHQKVMAATTATLVVSLS